MGSAIGGIASQITNVGNNMPIIGSAVGAANRATGGWADPFGNSGQGSNWLQQFNPQTPSAPGVPQNLTQLREGQLAYANQFQKNLPQLQNQMAQQLTNQSNNQMNAQIKQVKNNNQARGLTYGGINQGQQAQVRGADQQALAQSISGSNASLANAAQTLNAQAIQTGVGVQQNQQSIQNQIYQQQLAQMQSQNSMVGNIIGTGMLLALA